IFPWPARPTPPRLCPDGHRVPGDPRSSLRNRRRPASPTHLLAALRVRAYARRKGRASQGLARDQTLDVGAAARQLLLQPLKAAVEVVDAVDGSLAFGH